MKDFITKGINQYPKNYKKYIKDFKVSIIDFLKTKDQQVVSRKCEKNLDCRIKIVKSLYSQKDNFELTDFDYKENTFNYTTINYGVDKIGDTLHFIFARVNVVATDFDSNNIDQRATFIKANIFFRLYNSIISF